MFNSTPSVFREDSWSSLIGLPCGEMITMCQAVSTQYRKVTHGRTDRQNCWIPHVSVLTRDKNRDFQQICRFILEMIIIDTVIVMECEYETVPKLSNGTTFYDLEWPVTHNSRSHHHLKLNISEMVRAPFDRPHTSFYQHSVVGLTMALTCIISETKRYIGRKPWIFRTTSIPSFISGWGSCRNIVI